MGGLKCDLGCGGIHGGQRGDSQHCDHDIDEDDLCEQYERDEEDSSEDWGRTEDDWPCNSLGP